MQNICNVHWNRGRTSCCEYFVPMRSYLVVSEWFICFYFANHILWMYINIMNILIIQNEWLLYCRPVRRKCYKKKIRICIEKISKGANIKPNATNIVQKIQSQCINELMRIEFSDMILKSLAGLMVLRSHIVML